MKSFQLVLFLFISTLAFGQNTPVLSKVTATWCPNCGSWGWSYMESMKDEFQDENAVVLGVHFSGDLENETAVWYAENLDAIGQPRFYVNNTNVSVRSSDWSEKIQETKDLVEEEKSRTHDILSLSQVSIANNNIAAQVNLSALPVTDAYLAVYIYENNVMNNQAGNAANGIHPNVLRKSMSIDPQGISISDVGNYDFSTELDPSWNTDELGLLMIVWRKDGDKYTIRSSQAVHNVGLKLNTEESLSDMDVTITQTVGNISISIDDDRAYELTVYDMSGRTLETTQLIRSKELATDQWMPGAYLISLQREGQIYNKQIVLH